MNLAAMFMKNRKMRTAIWSWRQRKIRTFGLKKITLQEKRDEWNIVGLIGQVYVRCDESVKAGDFIHAHNGLQQNLMLQISAGRS